MVDYVRVLSTASAEKADNLISLGWELIDTAKPHNYDDGSRIEYHLGFPVRLLAKELMAVVKSYEKHTSKDQLFKKVAEEFDDNLDSYLEKTGGYDTTDTMNPLALWMAKYEFIVNEKIVTYGKKREMPKYMQSVTKDGIGITDEDIPF